jgi:hypothetical protein
MSRRRRVAVSDDTGVRLMKAIENSAPDSRRPRGRRGFEARAERIERETAGCYASLESLTYKMEKLAQEIEQGPPKGPGDAEQRKNI